MMVGGVGFPKNRWVGLGPGNSVPWGESLSEAIPLDKAEAERRSTQLLSDACAQLVAKQRAYFTAVKELKEEGDRRQAAVPPRR